jgi:hypothetical protein
VHRSLVIGGFFAGVKVLRRIGRGRVFVVYVCMYNIFYLLVVMAVGVKILGEIVQNITRHQWSLQVSLILTPSPGLSKLSYPTSMNESCGPKETKGSERERKKEK